MRRRMRRFKRKRTINILPSLLTIGNMYFGIMSIMFAFDGRYELAALFILAGMLCDIGDGKIARLTNSVSRFGEELDSLADLITFGLAPALIVFLAFMEPYGATFRKIGMLLTTVYAISAALRLARYNSTRHDNLAFSGLPSPAAALTVASYVLFTHWLADLYEMNMEAFIEQTPMLRIVSLFEVVLAFLMVSNIRYSKDEMLVVTRKHLLPCLFAIVLCVTVVSHLTHPYVFLFGGILVYDSYGPVRHVYRWLFKKTETVEAPSTEAETH
ncbi:CDP-diacylglycerol--serine O-phosphatidyltransferase [Candidatus Hydrogenedentota bacterium]